MSNPYLENSAHFGKSKPRHVTSPYPNSSSGGTSTVQQGYEPGFSSVEQSYYAPDAGPDQTGRMTYEDVIVRTAGLLALVAGTAAASWFLVPLEMKFAAMWGGLIIGLVLGLVNAFKKEPSPPLIMAYGVAQGFFLGTISGFFEMMWPGIVVQAVMATFITFGVTLALFRSGKIRVTPKFQKIVMIALASYAVFALVNLGLMIFTDYGGAFGLRQGWLGVAIGAFAVVLAAAVLVMDFDQIAKGVKNGTPRRFAWSAAFGLTVTLIWLYIEFLRILAILRGSN